MSREKSNSILKSISVMFVCITLIFAMCACGNSASEEPEEPQQEIAEEQTEQADAQEEKKAEPLDPENMPVVNAGDTAAEKSIYKDSNGDMAYIPADFTVSAAEGEQTISKGLVVIGPDDSEYVWIPITQTHFARQDYGSYYFSGGFSEYYDETDLDTYRDMLENSKRHGGFYIGRYEASEGEEGLPASRRVTAEEPGHIMVRFSPQDATEACQELYDDNDTVEGFFPWGITWDTTLQWLIDSGSLSSDKVTDDCSSWGNYSNDYFSPGVSGTTTGAFEETKVNNIYDLAGNNWEWTQERAGGDSYVMRGGGYNIMGGECTGYDFPVTIRDPLPGNDHHPNVAFRIALFLK